MSDLNLAGRIQSANPSEHEMYAWFIGQMGFVFKSAGCTIYIDPFLSHHSKRAIPYLIDSRDVRADLILGTHDHKDHIDRQAWQIIQRNSPNVKFGVPSLSVNSLIASEGIEKERLIGLDAGVTVDLDKGVRITPIAAAHEFFDCDKETGRYPYLGYVIAWNGFTIYHSGDTCCYEGLESKLREWCFDLMILPINGRDANRYSSGCLGNMTYQEAADLAGSLNPRLVIPAHYDLFAHNGGDPYLFLSYVQAKYSKQKVLVPSLAEKISLVSNQF